MPIGPMSRRAFMSAAAATAAATALPTDPAVAGPAVPAPAGAGAPVAASRPRRRARWSPQERLARLVDMRFGMFNHFNMGTFTDEEWATPHQDPKRFAPPKVDCDQWAAAAAAAKMSYGVLTTKHHDGFCLWPSQYTAYTVANASYQEDIVARYVRAFRARNLKVGLYYSIWDRTYGVEAFDNRRVGDRAEAIQPGDIAFVLNQIRELLTNYGPVDMFITDGYAWQMGQRAMPYQRIRELVKSLQPDCVMVDHGALSHPWLGDAIYFEEPLGVTAPERNSYASMQGQTISNGWFWHPSTPTTEPLSKAAILDHLAALEPRWTSLILNCPPNRDGMLDTNIVDRLTEVGAAWRPVSRRPLPAQPLRCEYPITPANAYATAFHTGEGPLNAIDGASDLRIQTCWSTWGLPLPQAITVDLGGVWSNVSTLEYLPKQWDRHYLTDGDITSYTISTSVDGVSFTEAASGTWAPDSSVKLAEWRPRHAGYVRLQVNAGTDGYANISELRIGGRTGKPQLISRLPLTGAGYRLVPRNSDEVAEAADQGGKDGANVVLSTWRDEDQQKWTFAGVDDGYFEIRNVADGRLLDAGSSRAEGGAVVVRGDADAPQQHWAITPVGAGGYLLTSRFSGLSLQADGTAVDQQTYSGQAHQEWLIVPSRSRSASSAAST